MTKPIALHDGVFGGGRANRPTPAEGYPARERVATPGHHGLDRFGNVPPLETMIAVDRATAVRRATHDRVGWPR